MKSKSELKRIASQTGKTVDIQNLEDVERMQVIQELFKALDNAQCNLVRAYDAWKEV